MPAPSADARRLADRLVALLSPDLLKPQYRDGGHPLRGHCYVVAEALYSLLGAAAGWTPMNVQHEGDQHWFLRHRDSTILDPTAGQFSTPVPYERARGRGFLTREPSRRAAELLRRLAASESADPATADAYPTLAQLRALRAQLAAAAQVVYDDWQQDESGYDEQYGTGGICDDVADAMLGVLADAGIDGISVFYEYDHHRVAMVAVVEGVYEVDIPHHLYERGSFYTWQKVPGVTFDADDVALTQIDSNPDRLEEYGSE